MTYQSGQDNPLHEPYKISVLSTLTHNLIMISLSKNGNYKLTDNIGELYISLQMSGR